MKYLKTLFSVLFAFVFTMSMNADVIQVVPLNYPNPYNWSALPTQPNTVQINLDLYVNGPSPRNLLVWYAEPPLLQNFTLATIVPNVSTGQYTITIDSLDIYPGFYYNFRFELWIPGGQQPTAVEFIYNWNTVWQCPPAPVIDNLQVFNDPGGQGTLLMWNVWAQDYGLNENNQTINHHTFVVVEIQDVFSGVTVDEVEIDQAQNLGSIYNFNYFYQGPYTQLRLVARLEYRDVSTFPPYDFAPFTVATCSTPIPAGPFWAGVISTSVSELMTDRDISAFPNPFVDQFTLEVNESGVYLVLDATGRLVDQLRLVAGKNQIDASTWGPGTYVLRGENGKHLRVRRE